MFDKRRYIDFVRLNEDESEIDTETGNTVGPSWIVMHVVAAVTCIR